MGRLSLFARGVQYDFRGAFQQRSLESQADRIHFVPTWARVFGDGIVLPLDKLCGDFSYLDIFKSERNAYEIKAKHS